MGKDEASGMAHVPCASFSNYGQAGECLRRDRVKMPEIKFPGS
jgi:hypothetical protein